DARRDREHGVALVIGSGQLRLEARARDLFVERGELGGDIGLERRVLTRERGELGDVLGSRTETVPAVEARSAVAEPLEDRLGALSVLPEIGARGLLL